MANSKRYFTQLEIVDNILEKLLDYEEWDATKDSALLYDINILDSLREQEYFIYEHEAVAALSQNSVHNIFGAIRDVINWNERNFGRVVDDVSNPVDVANRIYYILTDAFINQTMLDMKTVAEAIEFLKQEKIELENRKIDNKKVVNIHE